MSTLGSPIAPVVVPPASPGPHIRRSWRALFDAEHEAEAFARCWNSTDRSLPPVRVHPKALRGAEVWLRHGTTDAQVLDDTFVGLYHVPPRELRAGDVVLDLGGNIGLTAAHYAAMQPGCRVVCVEMDAGNAEMARRNLASFGPRCTVVHAAVWDRDGVVGYAGAEEWGFQACEPEAGGAQTRTTRAASVETILRECGVERAAFAKVDIEGAEARVLGAASAWLARVEAVKVEYHPPASRESMRDALLAAGFVVGDDAVHPRCVVGVRE
jgi:FkbM family methyltransferase